MSYLVLGMLRLKKQKQKQNPVPAPKDLQDLQVVEVSKGIRQHGEGLCGAHPGLHIPAKGGVAKMVKCFSVCMLNGFSRIQLFADYSLPDSSVHGILPARILEWVSIPPPGALPDPGIKPRFLMSPEFAGGFFTTSAT